MDNPGAAYVKADSCSSSIGERGYLPAGERDWNDPSDSATHRSATAVDPRRGKNSAWSVPRSLRVIIIGKSDLWPAPGSADTELGVLMELEVSHGETKVYSRVQT